ncbi:hypothetical protein [Tabrizicola sp. BL-A-41-H6]|uniref:hypothetical protein n=1 Tax=Tabrizicola sp. BL-A-41-H6 TaxID=3421107 RepID=UPI003D679E17
MEGTARQSAAGRIVVNPDTLKVRHCGALVISTKSDALVKSIADLRRSIQDHDELSRAKAADLPNARGIVTGAGSAWTAQRVTAPLKKARLFLSEEASAAVKSLPTYGLF